MDNKETIEILGDIVMSIQNHANDLLDEVEKERDRKRLEALQIAINRVIDYELLLHELIQTIDQVKSLDAQLMNLMKHKIEEYKEKL